MTGRLVGWRVLVPRGGDWGDAVADLLRAEGAEPVVAALIAREPPADPESLEVALARLASGGYGGLAVSSAATADVLAGATVPDGVVVGCVGEPTAEALRGVGIHPHVIPDRPSGRALAAAWPDDSQRVLVLRSAIGGPDLVDGLRAAGHEVDDVAAYTTVEAPLERAVRADLAGGGIRAVLVTSGSVARSLVRQAGPIAAAVVAALGPETARAAAAAGLRVDVVAPHSSAASLVAALAAHAAHLEEVRP